MIGPPIPLNPLLAHALDLYVFVCLGCIALFLFALISYSRFRCFSLVTWMDRWFSSRMALRPLPPGSTGDLPIKADGSVDGIGRAKQLYGRRWCFENSLDGPLYISRLPNQSVGEPGGARLISSVELPTEVQIVLILFKLRCGLTVASC
jgi:hypothetical protein